MLDAPQINALLDGFFEGFENQVAAKEPFSLENLAWVNSRSAHGSIILGALFSGGIQGKLTITLEWSTGLEFAEAVTHTRFDSFNETAQRAIEGVFSIATQAMGARLSALGQETEVRLLPTLLDTSALLTESDEPGALSVPVRTSSGEVKLFFSFR